MNRDNEQYNSFNEQGAKMESDGSHPIGFQLPVLDNSSDTTIPNSSDAPVDIASIRERLAGMNGQQYWRSLDELAGTAEFNDYLQHEFPAGADQMLDPVTRRGFLKVMGASIALAGLSACVRTPEEKIVPFVKMPEQYVPGKPLFYATALTHNGYAKGVLVESHMGRPTKVEGNPDHPASLGATDIFSQAEILTLYDPDRSQTVIRRGEISSWSNFFTDLAAELENRRANRGAGLHILTETVTSPTLADQMQQMLQAFPSAKWHQYEAAGGNNTRLGTSAAVGRNATPIYHFDRAEVVVSLECDFLSPEVPGNLRYARDFVDRRRIENTSGKMNRLYVAESTLSLAGSMADHRLPIRSSQIAALAGALAGGIGVAGGSGASTSADTKWVQAAIADLQAQRGRGTSLVIAGESQPAEVHAIAYAMNQALGNIGSTVTYIDAVEASPVDQMASLRDLVNDMQAGTVQTLIVLGGNPVYTAPADLEFAKHYSKVPFRAHLGLYNDETSWLSHYHLPESHPLESWGDAPAYDGTVTIMQPLIAPLYDTRTVYEVLVAFTGKYGTSNHDIVQNYWKTRLPGNFDDAWGKALNDGFVTGAMTGRAASTPTATQMTGAVPTGTDSSATARNVPPAGTAATPPATPPPAAADQGGMEIVFRPDPNIWDGRYANNGWLQELPKAGSQLTWDNAALISPKAAEKNGLSNGDIVELRYKGRSLRIPVWILPGQAEDSVTVHLGYGRERAGRVGNKTGFNAYALRTTDAPWFGSGVQMTRTGDSYPLVSTQEHWSLENRNIYRSGTIETYTKNPEFVHEMEEGHEPRPSLYPEYKYDGYAWGMAIDLNACIGCNACTIACQAENNIPVVGKEQVGKGREMHWIRVDRYFGGRDLGNPTVHHQPVPCMHCEKAPCELVCPVGATVHSAEGLNEMVYNRCVGTRYCSNNCPYKVRRFNFLLFSDLTTESYKLGRNPDVTVRSRGVMEKCTYCVQRINAARIEAKKEDRRVQDGEIVTACQGVCPTEAIVFGDINDPNSRVAKLKAIKRNYTMLAELNTQPRTSYLAKLTNPNPALPGIPMIPEREPEHGA
jgi:molybdopterin-containing oxidoreductase family iron-sulfur binding subunit